MTLMVWCHAHSDPERFGKQEHPVLLQTDDPVAILKALEGNVGWQGRMLYLHTDGPDPSPLTAIAEVGWAKLAHGLGWHWVADGPGTHGFLRDRLFDWVKRGMRWTEEQYAIANIELARRGWNKKL